MEIRYKNTFSDLMKFNIYHHPRMLSSQIGALVLLIMVSWPVFQVWQKMETSIFVLILFLLINALFWSIVTSALMLFFTALSYLPRLNKTFLTEHRLLATEAGLIEETDYNRTEHKWPGITKVCQNQRYIFIYTSQHAGHVIPKRIFPDAAQADAFFQAVYNWQRQAAPA